MTPTPTPQNKDTKPANGSTGKPPTLDTKAPDVTKPADEKPAETTAAPPASAATSSPPSTTTATTAAADKKARTGRKVYIVVGSIHEFGNTAEAEKFLNASAAIGDFTVIRGNKVEKKQKISLR